MRRRIARSTLFTLALLPLCQTATAQQRVARLYVMKTLPGHGMQFEQALAAHAEWRRQHHDPWSWSVSQVVAGSDLGVWFIRSAGHTWADLDAYDAGFARESLEPFMRDVAPHLENISSMVTTADTVNVRWPTDQAAIRFVQLVDFYLIPGKRDQFMEVVGKFHQAIVKTDFPTHYSFNWSEAGGPGDVIRLALPYNSWADMAPPETPMGAMIAEVYGPEEAKAMGERFDATYRRVETTVLMLRPDLSVNSGM